MHVHGATAGKNTGWSPKKGRQNLIVEFSPLFWWPFVYLYLHWPFWTLHGQFSLSLCTKNITLINRFVRFKNRYPVKCFEEIQQLIYQSPVHTKVHLWNRTRSKVLCPCTFDRLPFQFSNIFGLTKICNNAQHPNFWKWCKTNWLLKNGTSLGIQLLELMHKTLISGIEFKVSHTWINVLLPPFFHTGYLHFTTLCVCTNYPTRFCSLLQWFSTLSPFHWD